MGRAKNGILGGFSGKVGPVVGYEMNGEFFIRSKAESKKFTAAELVNQDKMALVANHLDPLKPLLKVGFKKYFTKTGGYRGAVSYTRKVALVTDDAGFYIDPAIFKISGGDLPQALNPQVSNSTREVHFNWELQEELKQNQRADQLLVLLYHTESSSTLQCIYDGAFRSEKQFSMPYPEKFEGLEFDVYMGFVAADRSAQSDSQYLGKLTL